MVAAVTHSCGGQRGNRQESVCCWMWRWGLILSGILIVGVWNVRQLVAAPGSDLALPTAGLLRNHLCTQPGINPDQGDFVLHRLPRLPVWVFMCNDGDFDWTEVAGNHFFMGCPWCHPKNSTQALPK